MDDPAFPKIPSAQTEDNTAAWSITGLKLAIESGKDCLLGQAQQKQATEQRAFQLIPFCIGLAGILITLTYNGKLVLVGNTYIWFWATAGVLVVGVMCAMFTLNRYDWGYIGMEPKEGLYQYAAGGGERDFLKMLLNEYQKRIEANKKELSRIASLTTFAVLCALLGLVYGAISLTLSLPKPETAPHHETVPESAAPPAH